MPLAGDRGKPPPLSGEAIGGSPESHVTGGNAAYYLSGEAICGSPESHVTGGNAAYYLSGEAIGGSPERGAVSDMIGAD